MHLVLETFPTTVAHFCFWLFPQDHECSRSYKVTNQHPNLPWNSITHGFLDPSVLPDKHKMSDHRIAHLKVLLSWLGRTPSTAGTFRKKFRKNSGKTLETLSERFLEFLSRVRLECPKPCNSRHLRLPEHFQNSLPPSTAGGASFFRSGSGEGLPEPVMEFPAVLGEFYCRGDSQEKQRFWDNFSRCPNPNAQPPSNTQLLYFHCCLAVSDFMRCRLLNW